MKANVLLIGPRGVGKTSLLAAMYDQFNKTVGTSGLQLDPDLESSAILTNRLAELKSMLDTQDIVPSEGLMGSGAEQHYTFGFGKEGEKPSLHIDFIDFPGGYFTQADHLSWILKQMTQSEVIMIVVDAPSLMEESGRWFEKINRSQQVIDYFKKCLPETNLPKLIIFGLIKCEKYMIKKEDTTRIMQQLKEKYKDLRNISIRSGNTFLSE